MQLLTTLGIVLALAGSPAPGRTVDHALRVTSTVYGVPYREAVSVARCETGGTFNPAAYNHSSGASGLFQFLRSTWARTPFAAFSPFRADVNALAAGWLWLHDGRSWREWSCQP